MFKQKELYFFYITIFFLYSVQADMKDLRKTRKQPLSTTQGGDCGCANIKSDNLYYEFHSNVAYYQYLEDQITFYTKYWARALIGENLGYAAQQVFIEDIEIIPLKKLTLIDMFKDKHAPDKKKNTFNLNNKNVASPPGNIGALVEDLQNTRASLPDLKGDSSPKILEFLGTTLNTFQGLRDSEEPGEKELLERIEFIANEYFKSINDCKPNETYSKCMQPIEKAQKNLVFGYEVIVRFASDFYKAAKPEKKFYIINQFIPMKKGPKFSFVYHPFFYVKVEKKETFDLLSTSLLDKLLAEMKSIEKTGDVYPTKKQKKIFEGKLIKIKYDGFHYSPGRSEFRTSCRHALATLRLSIETMLKLYMSQTFTMAYCPKNPSIYPSESVPGGEKWKITYEFFNIKTWYYWLYFLGRIPDIPDKTYIPPEKEKEIEEPKPKDEPIVVDDPIIEEKPKDKPPVRDIPELKGGEPRKKIKIIIIPPMKKKIRSPPIPIEFKATLIIPSGEPVGDFVEPDALFLEYIETHDIRLPFDCDEFEVAINFHKFSEETDKLAVLTFNLENIKFNCQATIEIEGERPPSMYGVINYMTGVIGWVKFFIIDSPDDIMKYCYEIDVDLLSHSVNILRCVNEIVFTSQDFPDPSVADIIIHETYYKGLVEDLAFTFGQIHKSDSSTLFVKDIYDKMLMGFKIEIDTEYFLNLDLKSTLNIINGDTLNQQFGIEGSSGKDLLCSFNVLIPNAIFKIIMYDSNSTYIKLIFDSGYIYQEIYINKSFSIPPESMIEIENLTKEMTDNKISQGEIDIEMADKYDVLIKNFLEVNYMELFRESMMMILKTSDPEIDDNTYSGFGFSSMLIPYLKTNIIGFNVLVSIVSSLMMNIEYYRLEFAAAKLRGLGDVVDICKNFLELGQKTSLEEFDKEKLKSFWEIFDTFEVNEKDKNIFGMNDKIFETWLWKLKDDKWNLGSIEDSIKLGLVDELEGLYGEQDIDFLTNFDLFYLKEKYLYDQTNYKSILLGNKNFQRKTIVSMWMYDFYPLKSFHIKFQNFYFQNEFILSVSSYYDMIIHLRSLIIDVDNHTKLLVQQSLSDTGDCGDLTFTDIRKSLLEVLEKLKEKEDGGTLKVSENIGICEDPKSFQAGIGSKDVKKDDDDKENNIMINFFTKRFSDSNPLTKIDLSTACTQEDMKNYKPAISIFNKKNEGMFVIKIFGNRNRKDTKTILDEKNPGQNIVSEYKFARKVCFDYIPVLKRYLTSALTHYFTGEFLTDDEVKFDGCKGAAGDVVEGEAVKEGTENI